MEKPSKFVWTLARQLIDEEAATGNGTDAAGSALVSAKVQTVVTRFAGPDAFSALMRRSLAISKAEVPALKGVQADRGGCLIGLEDIADVEGVDPGTAIIVNLLWLLVTFMGEPVVFRLVRDVWPDLPTDELK